MSHTEAESWLKQEAVDLLEQGAFGLYELVWGLRGTSFDLTDNEAMALARRVVRQIVSSGQAQIFAVSWPTLEIVEGPLSIEVLNDASTWSEGESGPLAALVPFGSPSAGR